MSSVKEHLFEAQQERFLDWTGTAWIAKTWKVSQRLTKRLLNNTRT